MKKRQFSLAMAGIAVAALLSSAPAMAQAYNENNTGWNRGGTLKTDTAGKVPMCFKTFGSGKFDGPRLVGTSDAATHGWQNFWGPCGGDVKGNTGSSFGAAAPRDLKHAHR
jgi:hypothetical protein